MEEKNLSQIIDRVRRMEACFDAVSAAAKAAPLSVKESAVLQEKLQELARYQASGQWLADYECDERGELPADLKRGVLSQDGLYDLLRELEISER